MTRLPCGCVFVPEAARLSFSTDAVTGLRWVTKNETVTPPRIEYCDTHKEK